MEFFKLEGVILKDKGMLADNSTKLDLLVPEVSPEVRGQISEMHKKRVVDVIIAAPGELELIKEFLDQYVDAKQELT